MVKILGKGAFNTTNFKWYVFCYCVEIRKVKENVKLYQSREDLKR